MFKMPDSGDSAGVTAAVANGAEKTSNEIPSSVPTKPSSPKVKPNYLKESLQYTTAVDNLLWMKNVNGLMFKKWI